MLIVISRRWNTVFFPVKVAFINKMYLHTSRKYISLTQKNSSKSAPCGSPIKQNIHCRMTASIRTTYWFCFMLTLTHLFALRTEICQPEWNYFSGYCYFTSSTCSSWPTAKKKCIEMGSHLATVHNQEENVYIQHRHNGEKSWIGLNDRSVEGSFVWTNKGTSSFRFWAPNQPNNYTDQDCVHTLGAKNEYTWNDVSCDNCFKFTCFKGKQLRFEQTERLYLEPF